MELLDGTGAVLDAPDWPVLTAQPQLPPARIWGTTSIAEWSRSRPIQEPRSRRGQR